MVKPVLISCRMREINMSFVSQLPDWLVACFRIALLGEIYDGIRAIAIGYEQDGGLLIQYYLDREPKEYDWESLEIVSTNLDSLGGKLHEIPKIEINCVYSTSPIGTLDPLSGFVFARRES